MVRVRLAALSSIAVAVAVLGGVVVALPSAADPATSVRYPRGGATTTYSGLAFDTCEAPSLDTMRAWKASPYRALGVYIGGRGRGCPDQVNLTASWVSATARMGWRLLPIYVGRQSACGGRADQPKIRPAVAAEQGREEARDAVARARALGIRPGSPIYSDIEHYRVGVQRCEDAVLDYISGWTRQLHRKGYLSAVYAHQDSGAMHLAENYRSRTHARPDALWIARWDLDDALTNWPTVPNAYWARGQRAKQYRGDHIETWGGVRINIDHARLSAPVATVARPYAVTGTRKLRARTGPARRHRVVRTFSRGTALSTVCQTEGSRVQGSRVWDKLASGVYVPDAFVSTPGGKGFTRGLPRCRYAYQVRVPAGAPVHAGPRSSRLVGSVPDGALARIECQRLGARVRTTRVWNRLGDGRWVSDRHVATPSRTGYSRPIPHC